MEKTGKYTVYIDDNFHYMDEGERYAQGRYRTLAQAVKVCRGIVDEWLRENHQPGMTAEELLAKYKSFGEDPWVSATSRSKAFQPGTTRKNAAGKSAKSNDPQIAQMTQILFARH